MVLMGQTIPWLLNYFNTCTNMHFDSFEADFKVRCHFQLIFVQCIVNEHVCCFTEVMLSWFFSTQCRCSYLRASTNLMKASLWCWPVPSQGHHPCLGCTRTLTVASQNHNRLWKKEEIYIAFAACPLTCRSNECIHKLNSTPSFFSFPLVLFIMQYARQWGAFKWDRVKDYSGRRSTTYITIISNAAVQFHNDKYKVFELHHR